MNQCILEKNNGNWYDLDRREFYCFVVKNKETVQQIINMI